MTELYEYFEKVKAILPSSSNVEIVAFEEGLSNKVYFVYEEQIPKLVLRVPNIDCFAFFIDRTDEVNVLKSAVLAGLSPKVVWCDDIGGVVCHFVGQPSLSWTVRHKNEEVIRIAEMLVKVHKLPTSERKYSVFDVIEHYLKMIKQNIKSDLIIRKEYDYLSALFERLTQPAMLLSTVRCHNDLNPKNILMDNEKLWVIDWEYSGTGDALFDLAVIARSHNLDEEQITLLITSYQPTLPVKETLEVISEYMKAYGVREMTWLLLKHLMTAEDDVSLEQYYEFKNTPMLNPFPLA